MSYNTNKQRLDRLEQKIGATIPADLSDLELNDLLRQALSDSPDSAALKVSRSAIIKEFIARLKITGLQPVKKEVG